LSGYEQILMQEAGVKQHDSESPPSVGLRAGAFAEVGTLILTNIRLVYVAKGGASRAAAWALGGALAARAAEKSVSQAEISDLMRYEGSYFVPLQEITRVDAGRKMGGAYLSVINCSPGQKPAHAYVFGSGFSKPEDWVNAINQAVAAARSGQAGYSPQAQGGYNQQAPQPQPNYTQAPPPQPAYQVPPCPFCGGPLTWIPQYQRWYCYRDQRYA
jgi:hypothetical protein